MFRQVIFKAGDEGTSSDINHRLSQMFILFVGGLFVGPAFDRFGSRKLMYVGTAVSLAAWLGASWSTEYWHFLLSQGILLGIGNAFL